MTALICLLSLSSRKRILATGGDAFLRTQQPDSTVLSEPSSMKERSAVSCDKSSVMPPSSFAPVESKKPLQIRRSSVISLDLDSDTSDSIINAKPSHSKDSGKLYEEDESVCDSPSTYSFSKASFDFSKKTSTDQDGSYLFFSPKTPGTVVQSKSKTPAATEDIEQDDFYFDDFDIDDFNDSDIPDYFDEPPTSSASGQNTGAVTTTVKEGGPSKSSWEKKPTTPASATRPSKICSPGKSAQLHC